MMDVSRRRSLLYRKLTQFFFESPVFNGNERTDIECLRQGFRE